MENFIFYVRIFKIWSTSLYLSVISTIGCISTKDFNHYIIEMTLAEIHHFSINLSVTLILWRFIGNGYFLSGQLTWC